MIGFFTVVSSFVVYFSGEDLLISYSFVVGSLTTYTYF